MLGRVAARLKKRRGKGLQLTLCLALAQRWHWGRRKLLDWLVLMLLCLRLSHVPLAVPQIMLYVLILLFHLAAAGGFCPPLSWQDSSGSIIIHCRVHSNHSLLLARDDKEKARDIDDKENNATAGPEDDSLPDVEWVDEAKRMFEI